MRLRTAIRDYLALKRSLGYRIRYDDAFLRGFARAMGNIHLQALKPGVIDAFLRSEHPPYHVVQFRETRVRVFLKFLAARGLVQHSLVRERSNHREAPFKPYIYSHKEVRSLLCLSEGKTWKSWRGIPGTLRSMLLVLYATGLRPGEVIRLRCSDVDFEERVLWVWDSKFHKSRVVPMGRRLVRELIAYWSRRRALSLPEELHSRFFSSESGKGIQLRELEAAFRQLCQAAGM